jgi:hypothetical protein
MDLKVKSLVIKDMNHLAKLLTELEGLKKQTDIAQIKEVLNRLNLLQSYNYRAVDKVMHKRAVEIRKARKKSAK